MALPTNNSGGPSQTAPSQGGGGADPQSIMNALYAQTGIAAELLKAIQALETHLGRSGRQLKSVEEEVDNITANFRHMVDYAETLDDEMKAFASSQKDLTRQTARENLTRKETLKLYTAMFKNAQRMKDSTEAHGRSVATVEHQYETLLRVLEDVEKQTDATFDADHLRKWNREVTVASRSADGLNKKLGKMKMSGWRKDTLSAERASTSLFGNSHRVEKYQKYAQAAYDIKHARIERAGGRKRDFQERRDALHTSMGLDKTGNRTPEKFRELSRTLAGGKFSPFSRLGASVLQSHAESKATNSPLGKVARVGMNLMERGEGSLGRGVVSWGAGMAEGGIGAGLGVVADVAPVLALLDLVKEGFDKRAKMNTESHEALAKGGIYGDGSNPIQAMKNVTSSLNTGPVAGYRFGVGYDKNLALAKAVSDAGYGQENLANGKTRDDENGMRRDSFGTFQRNAYMYGRAAGLSPDETTATTIKLISVYRQSLESTEGFFVRITKDSRAAGITTTKYIDMLDSVNGQYDRSNKLIGATVDTMKLLSRTGRMTADDMKDMMDFMTNGGKQQPLEIAAATNIQAMKTPGAMHSLIEAQQGNLSSAVGDFNQAMGGGYDLKKLEASFKTGGISAIDALKVDADAKFGKDGKGDPTAHKAAIGTIDKMEAAFSQLDVTRRAASRNDPIGLAAAQQMLGTNQTTSMWNTAAGINAALKTTGYKASDFLTSRRSELLSNPAVMGVMQAYGVDGHKTSDFIGNVLGTGARDKIDLFKQGYQTSGPDAEQNNQDLKRMAATTRDFMRGKGDFDQKFKDTGDVVSDMKEYTKNQGNQKLLAQYMPQQNGALDEMMGSSVLGRMVREDVNKSMDPNREEDAQIKANTTSMADIFKTAFESLFNSLLRPLDIIAKLLAHTDSQDLATSDQVNSVHAKITSGAANKGMAWGRSRLDYLQRDLRDYESSHSNDADFSDVQAKKQKDIDSLTDDMTAAQNAVDNDRNNNVKMKDATGRGDAVLSRLISDAPKAKGGATGHGSTTANVAAAVASGSLSSAISRSNDDLVAAAGGGSVNTTYNYHNVNVNTAPLPVMAGARQANDSGSTPANPGGR